MVFCTLGCALLGLLSPSNKGSILTALLLIFVFMGSLAGYWSARVYKLFHGKEWKKSTLLTASLYPGIIGAIFLAINGAVYQQGSSTAAPVTTILSVLLLWFGVSTPLVFIGSYFGFKKETIGVPVKTNQISRHIPDQVPPALRSALTVSLLCRRGTRTPTSLWLWAASCPLALSASSCSL
jgi:transmembrane 9 superfamily member 2/4